MCTAVRPCHAVGNFYTERASGFTGAAADALVSMMFQRKIVGLYGSWDFRLHGSQVIIFIYQRNINICRAGLAVPAIGALTLSEPVVRGAA